MSLAALLQPLASLDDVVVVHGMRDSISELFALPLVASLDALLDAWPDVVHVHLPDIADEASSITASPADARKLFATGMGLLFDEAHRFAPLLVGWLDAIRADLGLSALTQQRCLIYATRAGYGTAPHFDQNVNFVLQVHGKKTWWLAPNAHVAYPLTRHTMGLPPDPELATYATLPLPDEMPAARTEIILEPGSVLFVPRGTWHATRATSDALSLNFTFSPPSWIDLVTAALRGRLARSADWRATAQPGSPELARLLRELPALTAEEILALTEGEDP